MILLWYVGWVTNNTTLGKDMEWGSCSNEMQGATTVNSSLNVSGKATFGQKLTPISNSVFSIYNNLYAIKKAATWDNKHVVDVIYQNAGQLLMVILQ